MINTLKKIVCGILLLASSGCIDDLLIGDSYRVTSVPIRKDSNLYRGGSINFEKDLDWSNAKSETRYRKQPKSQDNNIPVSKVPEHEVSFPMDLGGLITSEENKKYNLNLGDTLENLSVTRQGEKYQFTYNYSDIHGPVIINKTEKEFNRFYKNIEKKYIEAKKQNAR